jgi:salicylate hydroxylase
MDTYIDTFNITKAKHPFKVIVVGAGIGGLAAALGLKKAGHDVVLLEQVHEIAEVGAGIQIAPNASRILGRLGLLEKVMENANVLEKNSLRRYANNAELGTAPLMPGVCYPHLFFFNGN